ncbi:MAG: hypothetical protein AAF602_32235 [Myxococcota bacterium]
MMVWWLVGCGLGIELTKIPEPSPRRRAAPAEILPAWSTALCRVSPLRDRVLRKAPDKEGWRVLIGQLDGKGSHDELRVLMEDGKDFVSNYVELRLAGRKWLRSSIVLPFSEIMHQVPFPDGANEAELAVIEEALWGRTCQRSDPSLQLLVDDEVRWYAGPPVLPPDYVVRDEGKWRVYDGDSHQSKGRLPVTYPRPLAETDDIAVLATGQGVIAQRDGAHAWLFVTQHHARLRWPSEFSARVEPNGVEVTRHPTTMDEISAPIIVFREL